MIQSNLFQFFNFIILKFNYYFDHVYLYWSIFSFLCRAQMCLSYIAGPS